MFAFSLKIINNFFKTPLTQTEVCGVLNEKGFEVLEVKETLNDIIIKIDVRNNRSDMLCYVGVARELGQLTKRDILWNSVPQNIRDFSQGEMSTYNLTIENGTCESCVIVVGAPKKIVAQDNFYKVLEVAGVEISTNCYINIINYFAILYGVSISIIDMDSINSKDILISSVQNSDCVFSGCVIPKGSIIISNNERILSVPCFCSTNAKCDTPLEKKCLMILGVYNRTLIRKTSKKMLQQDASAYIMSRGGNDYYYWMVVEKIKEYFTLFELKFIKQSCECEITVSISRLCDIVGNHFEADLICNVFDKCGFNARMIDDDFIRLTIPSVRQDVTSEIEAIEEFIRVYGYNKIIPSIPLIPAIVKKDERYEKLIKAKKTAVLLGFDECIGNMLVGDDYNKKLGLQKGEQFYSEIQIMNPVTWKQSTIATTLLYNLLQNLQWCYVENSKKVALFEVTRIGRRDEEKPTGFTEEYHIGLLFGGVKCHKGFGLEKNILYDFCDIFEILQTFSDSFSIEVLIKEREYPFFSSGSSGIICLGTKEIGFFGEISSEVVGFFSKEIAESGYFYMELNLESLPINNTPGYMQYTNLIERDYNFIINKKVFYNEIEDIKKKYDFIININVKDIYINQQEQAVLLSVQYDCDNASLLNKERIFIEAMNQKGFFLKNNDLRDKKC